MSDHKPNVFSRITNWIIDTETDFVRLISTLLPWLVPAVPAWLIYSHAKDPNGMNYGPEISAVMGIVAEGLGLASLVTSFTFWHHNRKYKDEKMHMPLRVPVITYVFYLTVVMTINVVLDINTGVDMVRVAVVALFSLLSLPAGALLAVQTLYNERIADLRNAKAERKAEREAARNVPQQEPEQSRNLRANIKAWMKAQDISPHEVGREGDEGIKISSARIAQQMNLLEQKDKDSVRKYVGQFKDEEIAGRW